jgi:uncharacterized membrane protein YbhN (UPF0104 family)
VSTAAILALPMALLKGARWKSLLNGQGIEITFREGTSSYSRAMVMAAVTPGRVGDFVKVFPLLEKGCGLGAAVAYNVIDRLLDVGFVLLTGYAGMWYFYHCFAEQLWFVNLAVLAGLVFGLAVALNKRFIKRAVMKLVPARHRTASRACATRSTRSS